jgi:PKD repeat protein
MRKISILAVVTLCLGVAAVLSIRVNAQVADTKLVRSENSVPHSYIVVLEPAASGALGESSRSAVVAEDLSRSYGGKVRNVFRHAIGGYAAQMTPKQALALSRDPRVRYVEEDSLMTIEATQSGATWGLDRVDQRDLPLDTFYTYNATGAGVRAYIIDTGIRASHVDIAGRVISGYTAISDGNGTNDCNGHGTHVAGTTGGSTWGVAKGVTLVPVRVLGCNGSGTTSGVIAGVDWVTAQKNANPSQRSVANMSLGGSASSSLDTAVGNSINAGVVYAVAAGNSNANACNYSPARVGAAITVGATTNTDARASYSNFGSCLDLFAPGSSITSAWYSSDTSTNTISGTSMASPHVAGAAALYLDANPSATASQVRNALVNNGTTGKVTSAGTGSPNVLLYTAFIGGGTPPPNQSPTANFTFSCSGLTCSFTDTSTDDTGVTAWSWNFGDGGTSTSQNPSRTYASGGTYAVMLTVTDGGGLSSSVTQNVSVSPAAGITLSVVGYKQQGIKFADLSWTGAGTANVDVFRNNALIATTANDGFYTDNTGQRGGGSNTYRVCESGTANCSNSVVVNY